MYGASAAVQNTVEISGTITWMLRVDDEFKVATVRTDSGREVKLTGAMPDYVTGMMVVAEVVEAHHHKYGRQFRVQRIWDTGFETKSDLVAYLAGPAFLGIGRVTAKSIVNHFGLETLQILDVEPEKLHEVQGVGPKRKKILVEEWLNSRTAHLIATSLMKIGMSARTAMRVFKALGREAETKIKEDPYCLLRIDGVGFRTADAIAIQQGMAFDDPKRIAAGVIEVLERATGEGHCYLPIPEMMQHVQRLLTVALPAKQVAEAVFKHALDAVGIADTADGSKLIGLKKLIRAEEQVARLLGGLSLNRYSGNDESIRMRIRWLASDIGITLAPEQEDAIYFAFTNAVSIITGGPGTGKTTIMRILVRLLEEECEHVCLMAPTGRAARKVAESCDRDAFTVHRAIGYNTQTTPTYNFENPMEYSTYIIDESSMLGIYLAALLLDAVPEGARVVFVGDEHQLPSVEPGFVLHDIIASGAYPVTRLTRIYRQDSGSSIVEVAHKILNGEKVELPAYSGLKDGECSMLYADDSYMAAMQLENLLFKLTQSGFSTDDVRVLSPMRKRDLGINAINPRLQGVLNPGDRNIPQIKFGDVTFREGDPVMQLRNDYDKSVFNGDIGRIERIGFDDLNQKFVDVDYPGTGRVRYSVPELEDLQLAYAATIHKSQGSEYGVVLMVLHPSQEVMLKRQIAYTGLTRARKACVIIGTDSALQRAIDNNEEAIRFTLLGERLAKE